MRGSHLECGVPDPGHDDLVVSAALLCALPEESLLPCLARGARWEESSRKPLMPALFSLHIREGVSAGIDE